ncbi:TadE/TadG family type IV pilus assembly protein [Caulobacter sp. 17J80-11]|uniref:TadE/TadG family type IV pilus assembly protein n=1 Tax=Caulobacter sp. 17J80-11 TaxID=2763502 RepID=UPI0016535CBE|nr:TadE/TadG family type IV pilus assembly protein [Caulobacter sp. 17J80-11]MBC6981645.1 pilus assembly protein [Caulobacter sp. 17J80-11]
MTCLVRKYAARARAFARDLIRRDDGATAVEFAFVIGPFLFMLFATLELALVFSVSVMLENATADAARRIRTGELQTAGGATKTTFRNDICAHMPWMETQCRERLQIDVRTYQQWADAQPVDPIQNGKLDDKALMFDAGKAGSIVLVRAYYRWPLLTPFLNQALARLDGGVAVIQSTATFRNEPY